jgi:putative hemolysin
MSKYWESDIDYLYEMYLHEEQEEQERQMRYAAFVEEMQLQEEMGLINNDKDAFDALQI